MKIYKMALVSYNSETVFEIANTRLGLIRKYNKSYHKHNKIDYPKLRLSDLNNNGTDQQWNVIEGTFNY